MKNTFYYPDDTIFRCNVKTYTELNEFGILRYNKELKVITLTDKSLWDLEDGLWIARS
jgi:hypothetical protein